MTPTSCRSRSRPTTESAAAAVAGAAFVVVTALVLAMAAWLPALAAGATPAAPAAGASAPAPTGAASAPAPAAAASAPAASLDRRIQQVKAEVIALERDLLVLEEELLFPANTQLAVFVSMDVGRLFELGSVQLLLDGKVVANHLYTPLEVRALHRGGVQRLYLGHLRAGRHELVAFFTGRGPHEREYRRGTTLVLDKGAEPRYVELRIKDSTDKLQPVFEVQQWQ